MLRSRFVALACGGLLLALAAASPPAAAQGETGFLRSTNRTDASLSYDFESFDHYWDGTHRTSSSALGTETRQSLNLNIAHGIDEKSDFVLNFTYANAKSDGTANLKDETALQDATGIVKVRLSEQRLGPGALSLLFEPGVSVPMTNYETKTFNSLGSGEVAWLARGILHYRFDFGLYASIEAGWDFRMNLPDQIPLNATIGYTFFDRLTLSPFFSLLRTRDGIDISEIPQRGDFPDVKEEYERWGATAYLRLSSQYGLTAGYRTTLNGRNTGDTTAYWGGIVIKF